MATDSDAEIESARLRDRWTFMTFTPLSMLTINLRAFVNPKLRNSADLLDGQLRRSTHRVKPTQFAFA
jgi:hypothetical protein